MIKVGPSESLPVNPAESLSVSPAESFNPAGKTAEAIDFANKGVTGLKATIPPVLGALLVAGVIYAGAYMVVKAKAPKIPFINKKE